LIIGCFATFSCTPSNSSNKPLSKINISPLEKTCIEKVITLDEKLGKNRNHSCETISLSRAIRNYTTEIDKIDFSNCPENFSKAFKEHKNAWLKILKITDKYSELRGEMHQLFKLLEQGEDKEEFKSLLDSIWKTWEDVEKFIA
jgi:hypothetical protein